PIVESRVGGVWQLVMTWTQDGALKKGHIDAVITAYDPPGFLVATQKAEPGGGVTPGPEMRFGSEDLGIRTRLHLAHGPFDTAEFLEMTRGRWGSSSTKLDAILAYAQPHSNGKPSCVKSESGFAEKAPKVREGSRSGANQGRPLGFCRTPRGTMDR
ncbi:MAG TPA: hypothetical protein VFI36_04890, partial [Arthrobacter sp.]|nr:hypothetical protein [Arthrobacter sp.]